MKHHKALSFSLKEWRKIVKSVNYIDSKIAALQQTIGPAPVPDEKDDSELVEMELVDEDPVTDDKDDDELVEMELRDDWKEKVRFVKLIENWRGRQGVAGDGR